MGAPEFVDLHLHADGISSKDLATLAYFGLKAAVTCARDLAAASAESLRRHWDELVSKQADRLKLAGIRPMIALGLHPARLPWHGIEALLSELPRYFDDPRVVALGELGLHEGGPREDDVLSRQLELAARLRRPVIIHTPERDKLTRTKRILALVRDSPLETSRVLIDHVSDETFPLVHGLGCWAGLTLQPDGFAPEAAAALVSRQGAERIVLTSDIGEGASDLLALPKAENALRSAGLPEEVTRRLLWEGPLAFLSPGRREAAP
jgi:predicted metal-dependent TIM-barrel fold hydrolase